MFLRDISRPTAADDGAADMALSALIWEDDRERGERTRRLRAAHPPSSCEVLLEGCG
ncbi:protein of unknown function [Bradyrhizobium vignae]|uniref:Uncharacterized protein n=1 Tax=Bradyrhizobium vignae TaxID=1549949 RepID=A0A2U3PQ72_9BRAD|nr:protein of unknown function [Bradyrhizobium vignae]